METVDEIKNQLNAATHGNEGNVEAMQTSSGVKDPIAQYWINQLIQKGRRLHHERITNTATQDSRLKDRRLKGPARQAVRKDIIDGIEHELMNWLATQPAHRYNDLPEDSRKYVLLAGGSITHLQCGST